MIMEQHFLFKALILTTTSLYVYGDNTITIQTKLGSVIGHSETKTLDGVTCNYNVFKGIPYAKPPIGELRFQEPVRYGTWQGTLDARHFGPSCIQPDPSIINQSEDCLFLNIYTPERASKSNRKSVMIWIHPGGYIYGDGKSYDASSLSVTGDVIVVTLNFRLNVFGFLSSTNDLIPGNYGLWDQKLAIQWVNKNIESFGGDLKSITLFGESSGASCVSLQTIHPKNRGLFHRAIMQSGTGNSILATSPIARDVALRLMKTLNCCSEFTHDALKCIKNKTTTELLDAYTKTDRDHVGTLSVHILFAFGPVVDGKFLDDTPSNIILSSAHPGSKLFKSLDVIIGNVESEGSVLFQFLDPIKNNLSFKLKEGIPSDYFCNNIVTPYNIDFYSGDITFVSEMCNKYYANSSLQQGRNAIDFFGDVTIFTPAVQSLIVHAVRNSKTNQFQYLIRRNKTMELYPWFRGTPHMTELKCLFPDQDASSDDVRYGMRLMKYWTNFARTGDVNGSGVERWPRYDYSTRRYALIADNVTIRSNLLQERLEFFMILSTYFRNLGK